MALISGCGLIGGPKTVPADVPNRITVTSPGVTPQGVMGLAYTCHGTGRYPGIHWSGAPAGTKSLAVVMDDSAAPITPYIYWIVFNIGPQTTSIQTGQIPGGDRQARNSKGKVGYNPPCPVGQSHLYRLRPWVEAQAAHRHQRKVGVVGDSTSSHRAWQAHRQGHSVIGSLQRVK